jgi:tetratricopeptide (TPR) repeat protein
MVKKQLIGISIAVLLVILLFSLPKVVVESQERDDTPTTQEAGIADSQAAAGHDDHEGHDHDQDHDHDHSAGMHAAELASADRQIAERLQEKIGKSENKEKSAIFADSLAALYAHALRYDSAAYYAEQALSFHKTLPRVYQAGAYSAEAFKYAVEPQKQQLFSKKTENFLLQVLEQEPDRLEAKTKLAMIYVASENPMKGIRLLQEVLEKEPDHTEALFNMGVLSVQSGQYAKAAERFERLTNVDASHVQGQFYLAYSYLQLGRKAEAKTRLLKVKELDQSPEVLAAVDEYLKNL